jgi:hypothetical protein
MSSAGPISKPLEPLALASAPALTERKSISARPARSRAASIASSAPRRWGRAAAARSRARRGRAVQEDRHVQVPRLRLRSFREGDGHRRLGEPDQRADPVDGRLPIAHGAVHVGLHPHRVDAGGGRIEFAHVPRAEARLHQLRDLDPDRQMIPGEDHARLRQPQVGEGDSDVADQVEPALDEQRREALAVELRRGQAARTEPERLEGHLQRHLELLGPEREKDRERRVGQHARLDQVGPFESELLERLLEGAVVPQRERDRLVLGDAVLERHSRRERSVAGADLPSGPRLESRGDVVPVEPVGIARAPRSDERQDQERHSLHDGATLRRGENKGNKSRRPV